MKVLDRIRHSAFLCLASFMFALPVAAITAWVITFNDDDVCEYVLDEVRRSQGLPNRYSLADSICIDLATASEIVFPLTETWVLLGSAFSLFALWKDREEHR